MGFKIGAFGYGLAAILGVGAIILCAMGNNNWITFLVAAIGLWIFSVIMKKI